MTLQEFVDALNAKFKTDNYVFEVQQGPKYARVVCTKWGQNSVYCFVDADGNVLKAASWKAPAKGIRANLATLDMSYVDAYGSWLYR
jgi:hypothetical protein